MSLCPWCVCLCAGSYSGGTYGLPPPASTDGPFATTSSNFPGSPAVAWTSGQQHPQQQQPPYASYSYPTPADPDFTGGSAMQPQPQQPPPAAPPQPVASQWGPGSRPYSMASSSQQTSYAMSPATMASQAQQPPPQQQPSPFSPMHPGRNARMPAGPGIGKAPYPQPSPMAKVPVSH